MKKIKVLGISADYLLEISIIFAVIETILPLFRKDMPLSWIISCNFGIIYFSWILGFLNGYNKTYDQDWKEELNDVFIRK